MYQIFNLFASFLIFRFNNLPHLFLEWEKTSFAFITIFVSAKKQTREKSQLPWNRTKLLLSVKDEKKERTNVYKVVSRFSSLGVEDGIANMNILKSQIYF
jgi:hypothetical protein